MANDGEERRERARPRVWLPVRVRAAGGEVLAVTYDASDRGLLLLAAKALEVGARVTVALQLPHEVPHERAAEGRVVRAGPNELDPDGLWPHRVAVALDAPVEGLQAELTALAREFPGV